MSLLQAIKYVAPSDLLNGDVEQQSRSTRRIRSRSTLDILNQLELPHRTVYEPIRSSQDAWQAIQTMRVRGAPAIAIVAALSVIIELENHVLSASQGSSSSSSSSSSTTVPTADSVYDLAMAALDYLLTSRPTAVNLADAVRKLRRVLQKARRARTDVRPDELLEAYRTAAIRMLEDDVADNEAMGRCGAEWILKHAQTTSSSINNSITETKSTPKTSVLTHCNTGSLATAGYGTALGVIRSLHARSSLDRAYCTETRPYNQGSRLTAFELVHDGLPATLITDSMAAALLRRESSRPDHPVPVVVVGADRVAANGDTANKVGTYSLAILARHHGVKFVVVAPRTTIDRQTRSGEDIVIEERPGSELCRVTGARLSDDDLHQVVPDRLETVVVAAAGIDVWNPAFDVTPAELIDAIVTEVGVVEKRPDGVFSFDDVFAKVGR